MTNPLHKELTRLENRLMAISRMAEASINKSVNALEDRDVDLAKEVLEDDYQIDLMEVELEEECLKLLALYQPVARDLRFIIAILKINNDLERVGDLACNIADKVINLESEQPCDLPLDIHKMAYKAWDMVHQSLLAWSNLDERKARDVLKQDSEIDRMHDRHKHVIREALSDQHTPEESKLFMAYLSTSRSLERIADHATNIAEDVIYMVKGEIVRHKGNK